jgi:hypothetical protein
MGEGDTTLTLTSNRTPRMLVSGAGAMLLRMSGRRYGRSLAR